MAIKLLVWGVAGHPSASWMSMLHRTEVPRRDALNVPKCWPLGQALYIRLPPLILTYFWNNCSLQVKKGGAGQLSYRAPRSWVVSLTVPLIASPTKFSPWFPVCSELAPLVNSSCILITSSCWMSGMGRVHCLIPRPSTELGTPLGLVFDEGTEAIQVTRAESVFRGQWGISLNWNEWERIPRNESCNSPSGKPPQYYKVISLQLKFKKKKRMSRISSQDANMKRVGLRSKGQMVTFLSRKVHKIGWGNSFILMCLGFLLPF